MTIMLRFSYVLQANEDTAIIRLSLLPGGGELTIPNLTFKRGGLFKSQLLCTKNELDKKAT